MIIVGRVQNHSAGKDPVTKTLEFAYPFIYSIRDRSGLINIVKYNLKIICHGVSPSCNCSKYQVPCSVFPPYKQKPASGQNSLRMGWLKKRLSTPS
jgi:hypothetical protein